MVCFLANNLCIQLVVRRNSRRRGRCRNAIPIVGYNTDNARTLTNTEQVSPQRQTYVPPARNNIEMFDGGARRRNDLKPLVVATNITPSRHLPQLVAHISANIDADDASVRVRRASGFGRVRTTRNVPGIRRGLLMRLHSPTSRTAAWKTVAAIVAAKYKRKRGKKHANHIRHHNGGAQTFATAASDARHIRTTPEL